MNQHIQDQDRPNQAFLDLIVSDEAKIKRDRDSYSCANLETEHGAETG